MSEENPESLTAEDVTRLQVMAEERGLTFGGLLEQIVDEWIQGGCKTPEDDGD